MELDAQNRRTFHIQNHPKEKNPIKRKKCERNARRAKGEFLFFWKGVSSIFLTTNLTTILTAIRFENDQNARISWRRPAAAYKEKPPKALKIRGFLGVSGGVPCAIRTRGLQSRSLTLYPAELMAHEQMYYTASAARWQGDCEKFDRKVTIRPRKIAVCALPTSPRRGKMKRVMQ